MFLPPPVYRVWFTKSCCEACYILSYFFTLIETANYKFFLKISYKVHELFRNIVKTLFEFNNRPDFLKLRKKGFKTSEISRRNHQQMQLSTQF